MDKKRNGRPEGGDQAQTTCEIPLTKIQQNPFQPRKEFDPDELAKLSASVRSHGILQPLVVRASGDQFQLIAGERRLRAAQQVGLATVPIRVVDFNDQQVLEAALAENIQRTDLNPIEKAHGFKEHLDRFGMNHDQLAERLGLARSTISNLIHLLDLPPEVQDGVRLGQITEAHAKVLKGVRGPDKQVEVYKQIVSQGLSVKATETMLREQRQPPPSPEGKTSNRPEKTAHVRGLEDELSQHFATPVEIKLRAKEKGSIVLDFGNNDEFMRLMDRLRK